MKKNIAGGRLSNGLYYSDFDILSSYKTAANKLEQITILCELNLCEPKDIHAALIRAGLNISENGLIISNEELLEIYKESNNKRGQIISLSKMNNCSEDVIKEALIKAGLDGRSLPRKTSKDKKEKVNENSNQVEKPKRGRKKKSVEDRSTIIAEENTSEEKPAATPVVVSKPTNDVVNNELRRFHKYSLRHEISKIKEEMKELQIRLNYYAKELELYEQELADLDKK